MTTLADLTEHQKKLLQEVCPEGEPTPALVGDILSGRILQLLGEDVPRSVEKHWGELSIDARIVAYAVAAQANMSRELFRDTIESFMGTDS